MHPAILDAMQPGLSATLVALWPKAALHLAHCLRRAGLLGQAQLVLQECLVRVVASPLYEWARADTYHEVAEGCTGGVTGDVRCGGGATRDEAWRGRYWPCAILCHA